MYFRVRPPRVPWEFQLHFSRGRAHSDQRAPTSIIFGVSQVTGWGVRNAHQQLGKITIVSPVCGTYNSLDILAIFARV